MKKFVGDTSDDSKKKIRTEDGTYLPVTYKSGRYERWQKKQKLEYQNNEDDDESTDTRIKQHDFRVCYFQILTHCFFQASSLFWILNK